MRLHYSHDVIVITKDRERLLLSMLDEMSYADNSHELNVIVVDSSSMPIKINSLNTEFSRVSIFKSFNFLNSSPGTSRQRNLALKHSKSDIVTFFDDDVSVPRNYFIEIDRVFTLNPQCMGAGPILAGYYREELVRGGSWISKRNRLYSTFNYGKITARGDNYWFPDNQKDIQESQWLPGCSMSYRRKNIGSQEFCVALEKGPGKNYAVGEDVDFSFRISKTGKLLIVPSISVLHAQAPSTRDNGILMAKARGRWKAYLCSTYLQDFRVRDVAMDLNIKVAIQLLRFLLFKTGASTMLIEACLTTQAFYSETLFPKLRAAK